MGAVALVGRVVGVRLGQALEGVGEVDAAVGDAVGAQDAAHQDADAAAPGAGLDQVAGNALGDHALDGEADVAQALEADHRLRQPRPVAALRAGDVGAAEDPGVVGGLHLLLERLADLVGHVDEVELRVEGVGEGADQQLEVGVAEVRRAPMLARVQGIGHATSLVTAAGRKGVANRLAP